MENKVIKGATASMVLGIVSIVLCVFALTPFTYTLFGVPAIICGIIAIVKAVKAKRIAGSGTATAGLVCGIVGLSLSALVFIGGTCIMGLTTFGGNANHNNYKNYDYGHSENDFLDDLFDDYYGHDL